MKSIANGDSVCQRPTAPSLTLYPLDDASSTAPVDSQAAGDRLGVCIRPFGNSFLPSNHITVDDGAFVEERAKVLPDFLPSNGGLAVSNRHGVDLIDLQQQKGSSHAR